MLMWTCLLLLGVYPRYYWHQSEKLYFEPSWIAIVTNWEKSWTPAVAICDLSQFVIKAVTWHIGSNNTENVFSVLGRVPRFTFDMNMKSCIFAHFRVISLVYLFLCISVIKSINDVPRKPFEIVRCVCERVFVLMSIPSGTIRISI